MIKPAYLLTIFTAITVIRFGECNPKCYICDSLSNPDCLNPSKNNMETQECTISLLPDMRNSADKLGLNQLASHFEIQIDRTEFTAALNCIKAVSKVHDKEVILRGCQLAPKDNLDVCKKLYQEGKEFVQHCSLCNEDKCNSASFAKFSAILMGLLLPIIFLI